MRENNSRLILQGDKLGYVDRCSDEWIACEVLVCALPYSHYIYAEALRSQKQEDFINGLRHALEYIGGVPQSIKCDNMRTAVVRSNRYEPQFTNPWNIWRLITVQLSWQARVRKPRDKGSVEKAVDLSYKHIYAPLRHQTFYSVKELNAAMRKTGRTIKQQTFLKFGKVIAGRFFLMMNVVNLKTSLHRLIRSNM